jgi:hypothetical protein
LNVQHDPEKRGPVFLKGHAHKRDEIMNRFSRIMIEEMEGVAGISRPRRRLFPGGGSKKLAPFGYLPVEYAPLRRKVKRAVKFPSFTACFFGLSRKVQVALHEDADRAMVMEGQFT